VKQPEANQKEKVPKLNKPKLDKHEEKPDIDQEAHSFNCHTE
jgi:hypothetical protein